jgi:hypothetical protein
MGGRETTQTEYVVQIPGELMRIAAEPLKQEFDRNKEVRDVMLKYTQAYIAQISQNAPLQPPSRAGAALRTLAA